MKTKMLFVAALLGAGALTANAGVHFGISIGLPAPVVVSRPVVYATPVAHAPVAVIQRVPPCPGVGYVWVAGYWSNLPTGRVWVPAAWHYRPAHVTYVNVRHTGFDRHDGYKGYDRRDGRDRNQGHDRGGHRR